MVHAARPRPDALTDTIDVGRALAHRPPARPVAAIAEPERRVGAVGVELTVEHDLIAGVELVAIAW